MRWQVAFATSPAHSDFGPLLFTGRLEQAIDTAAELGFDGIEISLRDAGEIDPQAIGAALDRHSLRLSAFGTGRMFLEEGLCFSHPEDVVRRRAVARMAEVTRLAAGFDAVVIVGLVRGARPAEGRPGTDEQARIIDCLGECADRAAEVGVSLVVEAINRYETAYQNTAEETVGLVEVTGRPNVGVLLDVFHMNIEETSIGEAVRLAGPLLRYVHLVDSNRWAPGWGHVSYDSIFEALTDVGYEGWLSGEVLPLPEDAAAARQVKDFVTDLGR